jgi:hypothetical protein
MSRPANNTRRDEVLRLRAAGMRPSEIAASIGCTVSNVLYYLGPRNSSPVTLDAPPVSPLDASQRATIAPGSFIPPVTALADPGAPAAPPERVLAETVAAILAIRDSAGSSADQLRAAELLLRHAGALRAEADWSPPAGVWKEFLRVAYLAEFEEAEGH